MDGLEAVELKLSDVLRDNDKFRIDSEFYLKVYLNAYSIIQSKNNKQIRGLISTLTDFSANGSYKKIAENFTLLDFENYAYMVRSTDLETSNFTKNVKYVNEHTYNFLEKSKIFGGELLINKIGSPGSVYLMPNLEKPVSLGMNLFLLKASNNLFVSESFLWVYFSTEIGKNIMKRQINGTVPLTIDKKAIKSLYIPIFSKSFNLAVENLVIHSELATSNSKELYQQSEDLLLSELEMKDWNPTEANISVKTFANFEDADRFDAEYFQPKYDEIEDKIKAKKFAKLADIVNIKKSIEPGSKAYQDNGLPFIRVSNLSKKGLTKPEIHLSHTISKNIEQLKPKKDTILLSKDGTIGIAYKIEKDLEIITSGAILHLTIKDDEILPDYLTLVFNSIITQMQADRDAGGSIIKHWRLPQIENVIIPILDKKIQKEISLNIQKCFALKAKSKHLLESAKLAVEKAIEEDEKSALNWLKNKIVEL